MGTKCSNYWNSIISRNMKNSSWCKIRIKKIGIQKRNSKIMIKNKVNNQKKRRKSYKKRKKFHKKMTQSSTSLTTTNQSSLKMQKKTKRNSMRKVFWSRRNSFFDMNGPRSSSQIKDWSWIRTSFNKTTIIYEHCRCKFNAYYQLPFLFVILSRLLYFSVV